MRSTTTLIIGAGQCGLAVSYELTRRGVDHLVLDAAAPGNSWRTQRWSSLRLLTPNWMNRLPGEAVGHDADGFMTAGGFADKIDGFVARNQTPVLQNARVHRLGRFGDGYLAETNLGHIRCHSVALATGACALPRVPRFARDLPGDIEQLSPIDYRVPSELSDGPVLVVGASASGLQIASEIARSGRGVTLAVGQHSRLPRSYRGADILHWMHKVSAFDEPFTKADDLERVRRTPSLPLIGTPERIDIDLNTLQAQGMEIVGRLADIRDGQALFSGGLTNVCASADLKMGRLLDRIDAWITRRGLDDRVEAATRPAPTHVPDDPRLMMDLSKVRTVVWATGFTPDHRFVDLPVFDRKGRLAHHGGVVEPGLYAMGLPYMRTARSTHIDGALRDAKAIARHITTHLSHGRLAA